jgi:diguanylate cyclase (GGDEF)-like protein/PAS domain S-box-containing protein
LRDQEGKPVYVVGDIVDITERVLVERALKDSEEIYREFVEGTDDLITQVDQQAMITFVNHRSREIFGLAPEECIGLSIFEFVHPEDRETSRQVFSSWIEDRIKHTTYENRQISLSGQVYHMLWTVNFHYGPQGELTFINSIGRDITKRKESEHLLEYLASHDSLTGLPNRSLFSNRLRHALLLAKRSNRYIAVIFIDLDDFKSVNDAFGHEMGDQVLKRVAKTLRNCVRESDTVARLSGDEFTLVVENISIPDDAAAISQKILTELSEPICEDGQEITNTASIGISIYPTDGADEISLLKKADAAMYQVKKTKNNFQFST